MPSARSALPVEVLSQVAGYITWLAVGVPMALEPAQGPAWLSVLWGGCFVGFGALFALINAPRLDPWVHRVHLLPLSLMTLCSLGVIGFGPGYWLGGILLIIVASYAAHLLSLPHAALWVLGQTVAMGALFLATGETVPALVQAALYLGFQSFALFTSHAALSEARAREALARVNAELRATQALLSESSRVAERLRIARELHDLIGHHLTALSLNLEVASFVLEAQGESKALAHVRTSQSLAKGLLGDVREVVSEVRAGSSLDLAGALRTLIQGIPDLRIHLDVPEDLSVDDPQRAQVVLRCVQEVVTNTVRHAGARNLWVRVARTERGLTLSARDDGGGAHALGRGNGLTGMGERLEGLGGRLELHPNPGRGFSLEAWLPLGLTG
ncbi:sensor histidine kinase [Truepera radiovictrix]|uniref:Integral membrane sensor signal transduction histidine kinase n=1 Tax=Truepera radiovictrix (strain DSM 17093 / CIP 108686 / LMG 22925 / RQ-24) TaxID=649638 RepID=D7CTS0_TRURR|nr:sensor histidine kinase [Truepera radiovictrix]ADI15617.1 integral membrane sensor signal transduction histidine kinase [Truepera radiovictrix DSM 17093]WMT58754.1 sensor histidine kinase [Truepera radiovictrix]